MRTDHISAYVVKTWLDEHTPHLSSDWNLSVGDDVKGFISKLLEIAPFAPPMFVIQNATAKIAIERWHLREVALLAGGTPTPLTPLPEQLMFFTDANPEAVEEARAVGYNTLRVDVRNPEDLKQLVGAKVLIATGLFHFLPDPAVAAMLNAFSALGFETVILTHATPDIGEEPVEMYAKLGARMYPRFVHQMQMLLPDQWCIENSLPVSRFVASFHDLAKHMENVANFGDVYRLRRTH